MHTVKSTESVFECATLELHEDLQHKACNTKKQKKLQQELCEHLIACLETDDAIGMTWAIDHVVENVHSHTRRYKPYLERQLYRNLKHWLCSNKKYSLLCMAAACGNKSVPPAGAVKCAAALLQSHATELKDVTRAIGLLIRKQRKRTAHMPRRPCMLTLLEQGCRDRQAWT